jgi:hypothetical protein
LRLVLALLVLFALSACRSDDRLGSERFDLDVKLTATELPHGAMTLATLTLRDRAHRPVPGAQLQVKGFMSHPGMAPLIPTVTDQGEGVYVAYLQFTMAGDWTLLVTGELPDGSKIVTSLTCQISSLKDSDRQKSQLLVGACT